MIPGEKINLIALEPEHLKQANQWINNPEVNQFLTLISPMPVRATKKWYESQADDPNNNAYAIVTKRGKFIGTVGLHDIDWKNRHAELGLSIGDTSYHNRGYGTDVITTLLRFAFQELNLHRVTLHVFDFNKRAQRCYEKCGFKREGVMRDFMHRRGKFHDAVFMGILKSEFDRLEKERCKK